MSRDWRLYVRDMIACCDRVLTYTAGMTRDGFDERGMAFDATVRNLELLGEAARQVPEDVRVRAPEVEWRKIVGLRNILSHGYFGMDNDVLWDLVQHKVPLLKVALLALDAPDG